MRVNDGHSLVGRESNPPNHDSVDRKSLTITTQYRVTLQAHYDNAKLTDYKTTWHKIDWSRLETFIRIKLPYILLVYLFEFCWSTTSYGAPISRAWCRCASCAVGGWSYTVSEPVSFAAPTFIKYFSVKSATGLKTPLYHWCCCHSRCAKLNINVTCWLLSDLPSHVLPS